jgi:hypothetical protein
MGNLFFALALTGLPAVSPVRLRGRRYRVAAVAWLARPLGPCPAPLLVGFGGGLAGR